MKNKIITYWIVLYFVFNSSIFCMFSKIKSRVIPKNFVNQIFSAKDFVVIIDEEKDNKKKKFLEYLPDEVCVGVFEYMPFKAIVKLNLLNKKLHKRFNNLVNSYLHLLAKDIKKRSIINIPSSYFFRIPHCRTLNIERIVFYPCLSKDTKIGYFKDKEKRSYVDDKIRKLKNLSDFVSNNNKRLTIGDKDKNSLIPLFDKIYEKKISQLRLILLEIPTLLCLTTILVVMFALLEDCGDFLGWPWTPGCRNSTAI